MRVSRRSFLGALSAMLFSGTVNPGLFDSKAGHYISMEEMKFSPATRGEYKVNEKLVFYTNTDFLRTNKVYAPYVPLYMTSLT